MSNVEIGVSYKNKDPYEGEGEIIIAGSVPNMPGYVKCVHALHTKYPKMNGVVEYKPIESILKYYDKQ